MSRAHNPNAWHRRHPVLAATIRGVVATLLVLGLALAGLRVWLPGIHQYRAQVEARISEAVGQPVTIGALRGAWSGWQPELALEDVRVLDRAGERTVARLDEARVSLAPVASLLAGALRPGEIVVHGAELTVVRALDGSVHVSGFSPEQATADDDALGRWLWRHSHLRVTGANILWHDTKRARAPDALRNVSLEVRNVGARHLISGSVALSDSARRRLGFDIEVSGNPLGSHWAGRVALKGVGIDLGLLPLRSEALELDRVEGLASFELRSTWRDARLEQADGEFYFEGARALLSGRVLAFESASGKLLLARAGEGWALDLGELAVRTGGEPWPATRLALAFEPAAGEGLPRVAGEVGYLRAQSLVPLLLTQLPADDAMRRLLGELDPHGDLRRVRFRHLPEAPPGAVLTLEAEFDGVSTRPARGLPGFKGLSGRVAADGNGGRVSLAAQDLEAELPGVFAAPIRARADAAEVHWQHEADGWRMRVPGLALHNDDLALEIAGQGQWFGDGGSPRFDLEIRVDRAELAGLGRYLPVGLLAPPLSRWLARSIVSGHVASGRGRLLGRVADFPFDGGEGEFYAVATVRDAVLDYAEHWPALEGLDAEVLFTGRRIEVHSRKASIFDARLREARAVIPDVAAEHPQLEISGQVRGTVHDALRYLRESPLERRFARFIAGVEADGETEVSLTLGLPLHERDTHFVEGSVRFDHNRVRFAGLGITLEDTQGVLRFTQDGVTAEQLSARYLGQPVSLEAGRPDARQGVTRIRLTGTAGRDMLARQLASLDLLAADAAEPPALLERLSGQARFDVLLDLPDAWGEADSEMRLRVESSLEGVALDLPAPLGKAAEAAKPLVVETRLAAGPSSLVRLAYGDELHGLLALREPDGGRASLERGLLRFGPEPVQDLPDAPGLHLGGRLARLSVDRWYALLAGALRPAGQGTAGADPPLLALLGEVRLETGELTLLGHRFEEAALGLARTPGGDWRIEARAEDLLGVIRVPGALGPDNPLVVDLEHLVLSSTPLSLGDPPPDPGALPPLKFSCRELVLDGLSLGTVKLATSPIPQGLRIDALYLIAEPYEATATGSWKAVRGEHRSEFHIELSADDLGRMLAGFGYEGGFAVGGATEILVDAGWPGSPAQFSLARLSGGLQFRSSEGRLLDVNPGATGRMFGLLTLASLPRRLKLDFSDLFERGFSYDRIEGTFELDGGNAYTNDLLMEGPGARIEVSGRTGLVQEDYDQVVTVTPKLASSLPVAGAVGGPAGVGVGTVIWLAEKLFKKRLVDRAFSFQYSVTGPWTDPKVERIGAPAATPEEDEPR